MKEARTAVTKILLVDDDKVLCEIMRKLLEREGFEIAVANSVSDGLKLLTACHFDGLLSDLHMPGAGDGLTMISAMRHMNPSAVALLLTSFPEMDVAAQTILKQADEILLKSTDFENLVDLIKHRMVNGSAFRRPRVETVATILERTASSCIEDWFLEVELDSMLASVPLTPEQRYGHLPQLFCDLVSRLRADLPLGSSALKSAAAEQHGLTRRRQGYSAAMMVEESRILQVSIFHTLQKNLGSIDFRVVLLQVMTIADEVDSQLRQAMEWYVQESKVDSLLT